MTALFLSAVERKHKRAEAHHLKPVVAIGHDGATAAVRREIEAALNAHGLIKLRVFSDDRAVREALLLELSSTFNAAPVQHIGKLLVLWRPPAPKNKAERDDRMAGPKVVKVRVFSDDRATREALLVELSAAFGAAPVQHIGKLLVLWRPPQKKAGRERAEDRKPAPKVVKVLKFPKSGNHRPQIKKVTVLGNMRLAAGGTLKRARRRSASVKKSAQQP